MTKASPIAPLQEYLRARDLVRAGDLPAAAAALAHAFGASVVPTTVQCNIGRIMDESSVPGEITLSGVVGEVVARSRHDRAD